MTSKILPENVVVDILLKLPVKSLLRFRAVCKGWLLLLDSPYFISEHLEYSKKKKTNCILVKRMIESELNAFAFVSEETLDILSPDFDVPLPSGVSLFGPINGIVAVFYAETILFCNPSTRQFKHLPLFTCDDYESRGLVVRVVAHGFGYDEKTNDFKFVMIIHRWLNVAGHWMDNHFDIKVEIYSLNSDCWRQIHLTLPNAQYIDAPQCFLNGACHWFLQQIDEVLVGDPERGLTVMSFRMDTETFVEIPLPRRVILASYRKRPTLTLSSKEPNNLSLILHNPEDADGIYEVWVMKEYGVKESWSKQYTIGPIPMPDLFTPHSLYAMHNLPGRIFAPWPIIIGNDNEMFLCGRNGEVVLCNLDTLQIRALKAFEGDKTGIRSVLYMETLVSLKRDYGY